MDKLTALIELRDKVKAGNPDYSAHQVKVGLQGHYQSLFHKAVHGSTDAALALLEAVLPGWSWSVDSDGIAAIELFAPGSDATWAKHEIPSRALLLAILEALISQEQHQ